jgi:nitroimidazol reductase NimA-like FMN-containing flavoprotein (pyridoxamine 5'-phosphate oxidase superfamily)
MRLAMVTPAGAPYVVPVWYEFDGSDFFIIGRRENRWLAYLRHEPRVAATIDTCETPYTQVLVQGRAEIVDENHGWTGLRRAMDYLGEEAGRRYFEETRHIPRVLIRIRPHQLHSWSAA